MSYMGPTSMLPTTTVIKMSKLQMLNVYASSIIFGYFLRRADQRFRLARAAGLLTEDKEDAVQKLERLFALVCCRSVIQSAQCGTIPAVSLLGSWFDV